ncbi:hypothetical protein RD149_11940 [Gordonia westfalica]|uniref:Uncharacterized protein n=1 Tax=Gordonia westfalica TaxID=158898 RepID=A0ABU2GSN7_9ACTN|nr:hypothetical protein [Gordonia westfalica]MDS1114476.1 hypothetical protein [Gordonia westfalica]
MYVIVPADQSDPTFADDCAEYPIITVGATWGENIGRYSLPLVYVQATSNGDTYMTLDRAEELCGALQDAICNVRAVLNADHHAVCDCDD